MTLTELFLGQLEREAVATRRTLERVPDHRGDWKPHEKSTTLGYLAALVASMPSWIPMTVDRDDFDLTKESIFKPDGLDTSAALVAFHEKNVEAARASLGKTTDAHLLQPWRFLVHGKAVSEQPRYIQLSEGVFNHQAHHRGQLTVYLRLVGSTVPAIYGPSADERIAF